MGAAIVRGMLTYSMELGDRVAIDEVDSVVFLEGAHDGVQALKGANRNGGREVDAAVTRAAIEAFAGIDFDRPAQEDLTPKSPWYRWANAPGDLPGNPYFNMHGAITIVHVECTFFIFCQKPRTVLELGDVALTEGTDDPFDSTPKGGSRFLFGALGAQNYQWTLSRPIPWIIDLDPTMIATLEGAFSDPVMHGNFLNNMADIRTTDCQTHAEVTVNQALLNVIRGRLTDNPYNCQP